jgi:hypothetical protein
MGLNVAGVDMLRSDHGPVVMEVNSSPGLEGIEKATGVDVAHAIIKFIERHAKPGRPRRRARDERLHASGSTDVQPGRAPRSTCLSASLSNHTRVALPVHVVHGDEKGPAMFLSGAIHGDEIQGVEIIRRILVHPPS